jgi:hypothetical protein
MSINGYKSQRQSDSLSLGTTFLSLFNIVYIPCSCFLYARFYFSPTTALYLYNLKNFSAELASHHQAS